MIDQEERYLEMFGNAIRRLEGGLRDGGPPVDWEHIVAFVDGALDKTEELQVQSKILTYSSWYEARLEVIAASGEHEPQSNLNQQHLGSREEVLDDLSTLLSDFETHLKKEEYEIAARKVREGIQKSVVTFGFESAETAHLHGRLSDALFMMGDRSEAEMFLKIAIATFEAINPEDPRIATGYLRLGTRTAFKGNFLEAMYFVRKSLDLRVKHKDFMGQANCLLQMGHIASHLNEGDTAAQYASSAVELQAMLTGKESYEYAVKADSLALIITSLSPENAVKLFEICHHIFLKYAAVYPQDLAICEDNFSIALYRAGKIEDAIAMNEAALKRLESIRSDPESMIKCLANLGAKVTHSVDAHRGLELLQRARSHPKFRQVLDRSAILTIDLNHATALYLSGQTDAAKTQFELVKSELEELQLDRTELYSIALNNLAAAVATAQVDYAKKLLESAIKAARGKFGQTIPSNFRRLETNQPLELILASSIS